MTPTPSGGAHLHCWTARSVWPQNIAWLVPSRGVPLGLDWDLWLGTASVRLYFDEFKRAYFPESCPPSSHVILTFSRSSKTKHSVTMH